MRKFIVTHEVDLGLTEIDKPTDVGLYHYKMPHWDEPQQVSVLDRDGELFVKFATNESVASVVCERSGQSSASRVICIDGPLRPTRLNDDNWPADAIWLQKKSQLYTNGFIIANHYCHSLASFAKLVAEARKAFPKLKDEDVDCRTVEHSRWCKRCPIIQFPLNVGTGAEGWVQQQECLPDVSYW